MLQMSGFGPFQGRKVVPESCPHMGRAFWETKLSSRDFKVYFLADTANLHPENHLRLPFSSKSLHLNFKQLHHLTVVAENS